MNFSYFLIFCSFLLFSCSDSKSSKNQNIDKNLKKESLYNYYLEEGKLDSAKFYIEKLYKENPNDKNVLMNRGEIYFLLNEFEISEESWLKYLSIDQKDEICYEKLIGLYCGVYGLMDERCTDIIFKTYKLNENNKIALFFEAKRFLKEEKINKAINLYEKLLENDSNNLRVLNELAVLYDTSFKSEFYYKKMLEIDSSYVVFYGLGMHFQNKGLFQKGIENYNKSLNIQENKESYYNIGYCYLMMNLTQKAIDSFSKAINIDASYIEAYFARGYSYSKLKKNKLAIEDYKFCLMLEPGFEDARIELQKIK